MTATGWSQDTELAQRIKISIFARGIRIDRAAEARLTEGGRVPLTLHEYATTGGVTFILPGDVYVNAPFDEWYCTDPEAVLAYDSSTDGLVVRFESEEVPVEAVPLPGYLEMRDGQGRLVTDVAMSHCDRVRLSPIGGCAFDCAFCDMAGAPYALHSADQLIAALDVVSRDERLRVRHILISGGTPASKDFEYYDRTCAAIVAASSLPVDVMLAPRADSGWLERLVSAGTQGLAINLEVYGADLAAGLIRQKHRRNQEVLAASIERAVALTGGGGRVRSLIVAGLEPLDVTISAVQFLAGLGCDPVLSPFRPARGTRLSTLAPPSVDFLERLFLEASAVTERLAVKLGPRCIPCQHNTLAFPDGSSAYYFS